MRFSQSFLDDIRSRIRISTVVGRHVTFDRRKSNPGRGDFWACCPFHGEKTPSFHCEDNKGRYHCFGCKVSGDIFTFMMEREGYPFNEAVEVLAREAGLELPKQSREDVERDTRRTLLTDVMYMSQIFYEQMLFSKEGAQARAYLKSRGLNREIASTFGIGYAPAGWSDLINELSMENVSLKAAVECGMAVKPDDGKSPYDRFRDRIMFPIRDTRGRVIAFGGRAMSADAKAKYLNSPETELFNKSATLYNLDKARKPAHQKGRVIVAEGYMDVIAFHRAGLPETVATLGTAVTERHLREIWSIVQTPTMCFDGDAAGVAAAHRAAETALPILQPGYSLQFALLPAGHDPDDILRESGPEALQRALETTVPLIDMVWRAGQGRNDRSTPEKLASFETDMLQMADAIKDTTVRKHYVDEIKSRIRSMRQSFMPRGRAPQKKKECAPSSKLLATANKRSPDVAKLQHAGIIMLCMINHIELLYRHCDDLARLEFNSPELEHLRTTMLDEAVVDQMLSTSALISRISKAGLENIIPRLTEMARKKMAIYALPEGKEYAEKAIAEALEIANKA